MVTNFSSYFPFHEFLPVVTVCPPLTPCEHREDGGIGILFVLGSCLQHKTLVVCSSRIHCCVLSVADLGPQEEIIAIYWDSLHANGTLNMRIERSLLSPFLKAFALLGHL